MIICKFITNIPEKRKVQFGIIGHAILLPFVFHWALQSPMHNVGGALILTLMSLFGVLFLGAMHFTDWSKVWAIQDKGIWLLKSMGILAFLVVMPYF